jgi:hypothetical protein
MDAEDCRENAKRCIEMANNAKDDKTQSTFFELANEWTKLANEVETNPALGAAISEIDAFTSTRLRER